MTESVQADRQPETAPCFCRTNGSFRTYGPHISGHWSRKSLFLFGLLFALYLHFCNGIRHLFWDVGYGFELEVVDITAKLAIAMAVILTIATWVVAGVA